MLYEQTIIEEMDHYDIPRTCELCDYFKPDHMIARCTSRDMHQSIKDMMGVDFAVLELRVTEKTDAGLCSEFTVSRKQMVLDHINDMIQDARIEAQRHDDHYRKIRREYAQ